MRAAGVVLGVVFAARAASAEPLPAGSIQFVGGAQSGAGVDARRLGFGYELGVQAAWQPMTTQQRVGWAARWTTMWLESFDADAAKLDTLRAVMMDLTIGARVRPGTQARYLTVRGGAELFRSNLVIPPTNVRNFLGPSASIGYELYAKHTFLLSVDLRYGMIINGPEQISIVFSAGLARQ